jgi:peroxiredoxin
MKSFGYLLLLVSSSALAQQQAKVYLFFDTECPICQAYTGRLQVLYQEYKTQATFEVIYPMANVSRKAIRKFNREYRFKMPSQIDTDHALTKRHNARTTPEVFVFDQNGKLQYSGAIDNQFFELGKARPKATTFYLADALKAITQNSVVASPRVEPVGCLINRRR